MPERYTTFADRGLRQGILRGMRSVVWRLPRMLRHSPVRSLALSAALLLSCGCAASHPGADLVLINGHIVTVDDTLGEVAAVAVVDGRIAAVGSTADMQTRIGANTQVIDLRGHTAIPGFIEGHGHFTGIGQMLQNLDLRHARNWDEVVAMVGAAAARAEPGEWILGRGWHQDKWDRVPAGGVEGFPAHAAISAVTQDNPVCLIHASGHACFFNQRAMQLAGVDGSTADPPGGEILRGADGLPIGVFRETAMELVGQAHERHLAQRSAQQHAVALREQLQLADRECLRKGITSFQDAGSSFEVIDAMRALVEQGGLGVRLWVMARAQNAELAERLPAYRMVGAGDDHLTVRAVKQMIDGALGSRGAWLLQPYADLPGSRGLNTASLDELAETARIAADNHCQLCVHAIGDRANREVLDLYQRTFAARGGMADHRWRIEHAQHLDPADIPRFASLGVIASMQGVHCTSDGAWVASRLGEERTRQGAYVWQKLLHSGALVTNGTDAPVEDVSPIASYYATVSRRLPDGSVFHADQRMSRMEALKSYTLWCAQAAFEETQKGSLTPGKLADITVLSQDILSVPEERIPGTEVLYTIVGGAVRYRNPTLPGGS